MTRDHTRDRGICQGEQRTENFWEFICNSGAIWAQYSSRPERDREHVMLDWRSLIHLRDAELAQLDIAAVNFACAAGLPGAERIRNDFCLKALDTWATRVKRYTDLAYDQFFRTNPAEYEDSEPLFR